MWYKGTRDVFPFLVKGGKRIQKAIWFGRYRIIECIGTGSFGRVYLAEHLKLKALRVIKQIPRERIGASSFLSEAELLKNLKHPGIPIIFDMEEDEDSIFLIEEYIEGESLEAFVLHQKKISEKKAVQIGVQLCEILSYLHGQRPYPLLYLDMKPEHVFLCAGQVRLVDFGISAYLNRRNPFPSYGTVGYAAPEQYRGVPPGIETDIFGVGSILSFLSAHGRLSASRELNTIIERATRTEASGRYATAEEMKQELLLLQRPGFFGKKLRTERHLLKRIAVCGSGARIGATHFSIALNSFFNAEGLCSFYAEENDSRALKKIEKTKRGIVEKNGFLYYGYFCGRTGLAEERTEKFDFEVADYGCQVEDTEEIKKADGVVLLLGARDWEKEESWAAMERYRYCDRLALVCNYGDERTAREYAKRAGRRVYCFPLDADAFCVDEKKCSFFRKMLQKEGW